MFSQLLGSRPARTEGAEGTTISVLLHGLMITAAIIATTQGPATLEAPRESRVVPLTAPIARAEPPRTAALPRPRVPAAPVAPTITPIIAPAAPPLIAPIAVPSTLPLPIDGAMPILLPEGGTPGTPGNSTPGEGTPLGGTVLGAESVDIAAHLLPHSPLPRYPEMLTTQRIEGGVRVRFVVSANGRAELNTLEILDATHPAFIEAVRAVLPRLRFAPAKLGRTNVRQLVEIPFGFQLTR